MEQNFEWQAHGSWPCNYITVIKFQPAVCHESAVHVTARHISFHNRHADPVCNTHVVGHVLGCWPCMPRLAASLCKTAQILQQRRPSHRWTVRLCRWWLLSPRQDILTMSSSHTCLTRLTYPTNSAPAFTIWLSLIRQRCFLIQMLYKYSYSLSAKLWANCF